MNKLTGKSAPGVSQTWTTLLGWRDDAVAGAASQFDGVQLGAVSHCRAPSAGAGVRGEGLAARCGSGFVAAWGPGRVS